MRVMGFFVALFDRFVSSSIRRPIRIGTSGVNMDISACTSKSGWCTASAKKIETLRFVMSYTSVCVVEGLRPIQVPGGASTTIGVFASAVLR